MWDFAFIAPCRPPSSRTGEVASLVDESGRIAVFVDWQNVYVSARAAFAL